MRAKLWDLCCYCTNMQRCAELQLTVLPCHLSANMYIVVVLLHEALECTPIPRAVLQVQQNLAMVMLVLLTCAE